MSEGADKMSEEKQSSCSGFEGNVVAKGYTMNTIGRGLVIATNVFMSTSLLYLASEEVGCIDGEGNSIDCDNKVYGFRPSSLLTNIAVITGLLAAFLNPIVGAIIDFTDHRHALGCAASVAMILIQAIQSYTVSSTWFPMAILQAAVVFIFEVFLMTAYAYLPELAQEVGEEKMKNFSPKFIMSQFFFQSMHLVIVLAISIALNTSTVVTAQISQGLVSVFLSVFLGLAWFKYLPKAKAKRPLPEGKSLYTAGFSQLFHTIRLINQEYKNSLRPYLLAVTFAEAGVNAFIVCAVTYMNEVIKMNSTETGVAFLIVLVSIIPGAKFSEFVTTKMSMKNSWRINLFYYSIATGIGAWLMKDESSKIITYIMSMFWGLGLGWYYSVQTASFSVLMPQEQATELSGLFSFCGIVLSWLPPLVFTIMNESGIHMRYGVLHLVAYLLIAILFLSAMPDWDEVLTESHLKSIDTTAENKREESSSHQEEIGKC
ncbi:unnamed protein product [Cylindrotheca closterium]|uniref:Major facilitator superfamily (MFS) profile domain-containing protein n=1 Tax=Cylindrotheca closterium TaxID=2856 RepID=A0AAD2FRH0_9STRA|nr:unnamed protein product [Cylindrotheca closterium]